MAGVRPRERDYAGMIATGDHVPSIPSLPTTSHAAAATEVIAAICGSWSSRAIAVAIELRIADQLAAGPASVEALVRDTDADIDALYRLLRALCSLGLCRERIDSTFDLTDRGALLRSDGDPGRSLRNFADWWCTHLAPVWDNLSASVGSGLSARKIALGHERFERLELDPEAAAAFDRAMGEITQFVAADVATLLLPDVRTIVDVGGGNGALLVPLLEARSSARGILYDLPSAAAAGASRIAARGLSARCESVAGDFFKSVPAGGDEYLLKSILHDWSDARCKAILGNVRSVLPDHGHLLVIERVMPERLEDDARCREVARNDLNMLVGVGGRERTASAYRSLLDEAGLELIDSRPLALYYTALIARPR